MRRAANQVVNQVVRAEAVRTLAYRIDLGQAGRVHITLDTTSPASGVEVLDLPSRWADARDLEHGIENLKITGSAVSLEPTTRPARLTLRAKPGTEMRLAYDLVQDWTGPFNARERHHVLLRPELVEFNGETGLVAPHLEMGAPVQVSFDFLRLPAGQTVVTSFGTETHQTMSGPWREVTNALFAAGVLTTRTVPLRDGPVLLAVSGQWSFSVQALALTLHTLLATERQFWQTPAPPWYAVVLAPFEAGGSGGGGSAFTNAMSVDLAPGEGLGPETESLLAHEAFHAWNPPALGPVAEPTKLAWFTEGVTTYYQDVLLERAHLIDRATYLQRLNGIVRDFTLARVTGPAAAGSILDADEVREHEPYLRGAMIALWVNSEIERQSGGRASLDDVMRALAAEPAVALTDERIVTAVQHRSNGETARRMREMLAGQMEVPVPATIGPCLRFEPRRVWTFALGMPATQLVRSAVLHGVEEKSAAFRAGLRDGQVLLGWSLWNGDPDHETVLTVRASETAPIQQIRYLPRGEQREVPQAVEVPGCAAATVQP